jgi:serine/threonine protein kinase
LPFNGSSTTALYKAIRSGAYAPLGRTVSPAVRDLLARMLTVDPAARITMDDILEHAWTLQARSLACPRQDCMSTR